MDENPYKAPQTEGGVSGETPESNRGFYIWVSVGIAVGILTMILTVVVVSMLGKMLSE